MAEQQQIAAAVNQVRSAAETFSTNKREEAEQVLQQRQAELAIAKAQGDKAKEAQLQDQVDTAQQTVDDWSTGGKNRQAVDATLNGLGLALGGNSVEAVAAGAASPYVNTAIKHATEGEGNEWANLALHGIWGAVEAATQGANALGGASSAVTGEVAAKILTEKLFGETNPEALTEEQKRAVSHLSQMIAGGVGGGTELAQGGDAVSSVQNVNVGMGIAKNAVENNLLSKAKDDFIYQRSVELAEKGKIEGKYQDRTEKYLLEDKYIDYLLHQYQLDPSKLNIAQKEYLHNTLLEIANSYRISVDKLYNWNFNSVIKRDDSKLIDYLKENKRVLNSTYDGDQAKSFAVGVVATPLIYGANAAMNSAIWSRLTAFSKAYPKTTEAVVSGTVSTGFDIYNGDVSYEKTLANYALGGLKQGKVLLSSCRLIQFIQGLLLLMIKINLIKI